MASTLVSVRTTSMPRPRAKTHDATPLKCEEPINRLGRQCHVGVVAIGLDVHGEDFVRGQVVRSAHSAVLLEDYDYHLAIDDVEEFGLREVLPRLSVCAIPLQDAHRLQKVCRRLVRAVTRRFCLGDCQAHNFRDIPTADE